MSLKNGQICHINVTVKYCLKIVALLVPVLILVCGKKIDRPEVYHEHQTLRSTPLHAADKRCETNRETKDGTVRLLEAAMCPSRDSYLEGYTQPAA